MLGGQGIWYPIPDLPRQLVLPPSSISSLLGATSSTPPDVTSNGVVAEEVPAAVSESPDHRGKAVRQALPVISTSTTSNESDTTFRETSPQPESAPDDVLAEGTRIRRSPREKRRAVLRAELKDRLGIDRER